MMSRRHQKKLPAPFWVTNISKMNVTLSDLALTIPAFSTINLMDTRHYQYTLEQLQQSALSGSLFKKRNLIVIRKVAPNLEMKKTIPIDRESALPSKERSILTIKEEKYEELQISDEEFALENIDAEISQNDTSTSTKK